MLDFLMFVGGSGYILLSFNFMFFIEKGMHKYKNVEQTLLGENQVKGRKERNNLW